MKDWSTPTSTEHLCLVLIEGGGNNFPAQFGHKRNVIMSKKIAPKNQVKGVDFCGVDKYYYIIRSDLGCFMRSSKFNFGDDLDVFTLHPACRGGDHYFAYKLDLFYIIFGDTYHVVGNLNTNVDIQVHYLHPNCQGGDHYLSAWDYFFIIFQERGVYRRTKNLNKDKEGEDFILHPNCRDGLYYFGVANYCYFVKALDEGGVQYVKSLNFATNETTGIFNFHSSVINFLPGGLAITRGPAYGEWVCRQTITNDSETAFQGEKLVTKRIGFEKEKMASIESNWKVYATFPPETGGLRALLVKRQFSLPAEYGGLSVDTDQERWTVATDREESIPMSLEPREKVNIWTYQLGLGRNPLLHCGNIRLVRTPEAPTDFPLPPSTGKDEVAEWE
ncbi:uncharacterized protein RB166_015407 [Leptodactylus fuscus]